MRAQEKYKKSKNYILCLLFLSGPSIAGGRDFSNIPMEVREAAQAVWQLRGAWGQGSGFFTAPRTLVTNYHVVMKLAKQDLASDIVLRQNGMQRGLKIKRAVFLSAVLDIAVLETNEDAPFYLTLHDKPLDKNADLFSLGYPKGSFYIYEDLQGFSAFHNHLVFPVQSVEPTGVSGGPLLTAAGEVAGMNVLAIHNFIGAVDISLLTQALEGKTGVRCENMMIFTCTEKALIHALIKGREGNAAALFNLARFLKNNVNVSEEDYFSWLEEGARRGHVLSQYSLGIELSDTEKTEEMTAWFEAAAEAGLAPAKFTLGLIYLKENKSLESFKQGILLIEAAAADGHLSAQGVLKEVSAVRAGGG